MVLKLVYPILKTQDNIALTTDKTVMSFYRIPNTPITITDKAKKQKHKLTRTVAVFDRQIDTRNGNSLSV